MKTNSTQFEMLVKFMEKHGDLNKPQSNPMMRVQCIKNWEILCKNLNSDPTGDKKPTNKWKKVWSDLKNNTKKKAARLKNRAMSGTSRPTFRIKLNKLEQRVLNVIRQNAATRENNLNRAVTVSPSPPAPAPQQELHPVLLMQVVKEDIPDIDIDEHDIYNSPGPSQPSTGISILSVPQQSIPLPHLSPIPSPHLPSITSPQLPSTPSPEVPESHELAPPLGARPAKLGLTIRRHRRGQFLRHVGSLRRPIKRVDQAAAHFFQSDERWREFTVKKHEDECRLESERLRLREIELKMQQNWQEIAIRAVDALHKIIDYKLFKD